MDARNAVSPHRSRGEQRPAGAKSRWVRWWGRPGWDRFVHVMAVVTFGAALAVFVTLAAHAPDGRYLSWEDRFMQALRNDGQPLGPAGTLSAVRDITALGSAAVLIVLTLLILGYLVMCRHYRVAVLIAAATAGGQAVNYLLKESFDRARPNTLLHLVEVSSASFPSGHSMAGSIFYLTIGALLARTAQRRREKAYFLGAALLLTLGIGFSRIYLGVHYPTDVLAGWCAGTVWALTCWFVADWLGRRGKLRGETGERATI